MNTKNMNYYEILGVPLDANTNEIRKAYLELVKKYHPDVYKEADGEEIIKSINVAYDTLINPITKEKYDRKINNDTSLPKSRDYETALEINQYLNEYVDLYNKLNTIIDKINNGDINAVNLLDDWLIEAYKLADKVTNTIKNNYEAYSTLYDIDYMLKDKIKTAEYYKTGDKQILNGCINSGQYTLDRLTKIKEIIIKNPQNKKTIMLCSYAKELLENYIGEVEFASNESFDYINLPFISKYINNMELIQSDCEMLLIENYQNILKQKEQLQNQYNIKFSDGDLGFLIFSFVGPFIGAITNTLLNRQVFKIGTFLAIVIPLNFGTFKKIYDKIKCREKEKENQNKMDKLDRFINEYNKKRLN